MQMTSRIKEVDDQLHVWLMGKDKHYDHQEYMDDGDDALRDIRGRSTLR